jgi:hypothetical protein
VEAATSRQTSNGSSPKSDWDQGYGYQFWRSRHSAYRGDGAFGQYCIVLPEQDTVIAITSAVKNMQAVLDLVWDKLLPALKSESLSPDDEARTKLERTLAGLTLRPQQGAHEVAKLPVRKYAFPANPVKLETIQLQAAQGGAVTLIARVEGVEQRINCGAGAWTKGQFSLGPMFPGPAAASGAWIGNDTYKARICFYETPFLVTLTMRFDADRLLLDAESNVGFGQTKAPQIVGKAE